jgi:hypothetical protein
LKRLPLTVILGKSIGSGNRVLAVAARETYPELTLNYWLMSGLGCEGRKSGLKKAGCTFEAT